MGARLLFSATADLSNDARDEKGKRRPLRFYRARLPNAPAASPRPPYRGSRLTRSEGSNRKRHAEPACRRVGWPGISDEVTGRGPDDCFAKTPATKIASAWMWVMRARPFVRG